MKTMLSMIFTVIACSAMAQYTKENLSIDARTAGGETYAYQNLKLYPIRANKAFEQEHRDIGKYLTLKDGLKQSKIKISESSSSGSVNKLFIENTSADTIMVLAGEVVQG